MSTPHWREERLSVAGIELHLHRGGDGPPLLWLHGGGASPEWLMHHEALAEQCNVIAPSHPGFGVTPGLSWMSRPSDMALFYLWMLQEMGLDRVHLAGHAFGGWIAAEMAATCPQIVDRLVLIDAAGIKPEAGEILDIFILTPEAILAKAYYKPEQAPEWERLYGSAPSPEAADRAEEALETFVRLTWKPFLHDRRLPEILPRVSSPTLIIWGRDDAIIPLECGELYRRAIPGAELVVLDECGHMPHIEKPKALTDTLTSFLR